MFFSIKKNARQDYNYSFIRTSFFCLYTSHVRPTNILLIKSHAFLFIFLKCHAYTYILNSTQFLWIANVNQHFKVEHVIYTFEQFFIPVLKTFYFLILQSNQRSKTITYTFIGTVILLNKKRVFKKRPKFSSQNPVILTPHLHKFLVPGEKCNAIPAAFRIL